MEPVLARLAALEIEVAVLPGSARHAVVARGAFGALIERSAESLGKPGAAGLITEKGLAMLVWRDGGPFFVARGFERPVSTEEVEALRRFSADLTSALAGT